MCVVVFFFKQKTAYEMRISDWSSDVCSSDLRGARSERCAALFERGGPLGRHLDRLDLDPLTGFVFAQFDPSGLRGKVGIDVADQSRGLLAGRVGNGRDAF